MEKIDTDCKDELAKLKHTIRQEEFFLHLCKLTCNPTGTLLIESFFNEGRK